MSVEANLQAIMDARYGKDVRQAIHDSIEEVNNVAIQAKGTAETSQNSASAYATAALQAEQNAKAAKQAAQTAAAQAMSSTPEGYADLVEEVESLKNIEDTSLLEAGTHKGAVLLNKMYGMSVQDGVPTPTDPIEIESAKADFKCVGKNLINPTLRQTITTNGITCVPNGDGTFTINGTASATTRINILATAQHNIDIPNGTSVKLTGCPSGGSRQTQMLYSQTINNNDFGNGVIFNWNSSITGIAILVENGITVNNLLFKPMLTLDLSATYDDYEPYNGQDVETNLILRGIEVGSNGDYNLVKDGKYYSVDTLEKIDGGYQIVRRVERQVLSGTETVGASTWGDTDTLKCFNITLNKRANTLGASGGTNRATLINNMKYRWYEFGNIDEPYVGKVMQADTAYEYKFYFKLLKSEASTTAAAKTWLQNNETEIIYALDKEDYYTESVSAENAKKLLSLKAYDTATLIEQTNYVEGVINVDYPTSKMAAKSLAGYVTSEKNAIAINELTVAMLELAGNE